MKRWLVFDTETTGLTLPSAAELKAQPKIIELALAEIETRDAHAPVLMRERVWLIDPREPLTEEITKITGLKDSDLAGKPTFAEALPEIAAAFLGAHGLCAHNLPFDLAMLVNELRRCGREHAFPYPPEQLCTVAAFHHLKGRNLKLTELYEHSLGRPLAQTHRAADDVRALAEVLLAEDALS